MFFKGMPIANPLFPPSPWSKMHGQTALVVWLWSRAGRLETFVSSRDVLETWFWRSWSRLETFRCMVSCVSSSLELLCLGLVSSCYCVLGSSCLAIVCFGLVLKSFDRRPVGCLYYVVKNVSTSGIEDWTVGVNLLTKSNNLQTVQRLNYICFVEYFIRCQVNGLTIQKSLVATSKPK